MKLSSVCGGIVAFASLAHATILQNGQARITDYPNTVIDPTAYKWNTYPPSTKELAYKGRWDSKHVSWWS